MNDSAPSSADIAPGLIEALRVNDVVSSLGAAALRDVAARSEIRDLRRGGRLWSRGDPAAALAVVARGRIKCWSRGAQARQWVSGTVRAGGICGLSSCVDGGTHPTDADAMERSRVVLVPQAIVRAAMERDPAFARRVGLTIAKELRETLAACEGVVLRTPLQRLAHYLVAQPAVGGEIELGDTQTQIAAQLGTVREVVGRGFRELQRRGILTRTGRVVRVLKPADLAAAAL